MIWWNQMERKPISFEKPARPKLGTSLFFLLVAGGPIGLMLFLVYPWYLERKNFSSLTSQFVQRQNQVLAQDAITASRYLADFLERASKDIETLSLFVSQPQTAANFIQSQIKEVSLYTESGISRVSLPIYKEAVFLNPDGSAQWRIEHGKLQTTGRSTTDCKKNPLCDWSLRSTALQIPVDTLKWGGLLRWYQSEKEGEDDSSGAIHLAYRSNQGVVILALDYRMIKSIQTLPLFPYDPKENVLQSYEQGNYVYVVDSDTNILVHPKYWHVVGVDRTTGKPQTPIKKDSDEGAHPINIAAYQEGKLREYFDRLLKVSFPQRSVDIFKASNLSGMHRILSVAPILYSKGQFAKLGTFGHVIIGCSVQHFEEPKERIVPYY